MYFVLLTLAVIWVFGRINRHLNRHLPQNTRSRIRLRPQLIR
jgi:polar amino acid transport system permease protein